MKGGLEYMEFGGYLQFPQFTGEIFHTEAIALNSARNCLAYLIESKKIQKIVLPKFLCGAVAQVCHRYNLQIRYYSIGVDFRPTNLNLKCDEWLYIVNYYGQISNYEIEVMKSIYDRVIIDNVQAYFQEPITNVDTLYTCRKFFGVPDGAFLYTDSHLLRSLEQDKSAERMSHLLGRYEKTASEYYTEYIKNETIIDGLPIRLMSKMTNNLLQALDYDKIKAVRERNFLYLEKNFASLNELELTIPIGSFMYPLYLTNAEQIREQLKKEKIYIPILWPNVLKECKDTETEYRLAKNILPLPCDQRYDLKSMELMTDKILEML